MARPPSPAADPGEPPAQGPALDYMRSSQARNWRFSAKQIEAMRRKCNEAAIDRLDAVWKRERSLPAVDGEPEASSSATPLSFATVEEEHILIRYYLTRVHQLVKAFGLPEVVEATAITFIKRFYLRNTCMDFHPKNIVLTCLFLAAKAESNPVPLRHFATKAAGREATPAAIQETFEMVQRLEFLVSQSLQFQFQVHGAHRALHGLFLDLQQGSATNEALRSLIEPSRTSLKQSRFTDAELIYTPSQIALACMRSASETGRRLVDEYIGTKEQLATQIRLDRKKEREAWRQSRRKRTSNGSGKAPPDDGLSPPMIEQTDEDIKAAPLGTSKAGLQAILGEIEQLLEEKARSANGDVEAVKDVDRKVKACQNPEGLPRSRISHHIAKAKEESLLGKRKSSKVGRKEEDPFGDDDEDEEEAAASSKKVKTGGLSGRNGETA